VLFDYVSVESSASDELVELDSDLMAAAEVVLLAEVALLFVDVSYVVV